MNKFPIVKNASCNAAVQAVDQSTTPYAWPSGRLQIFDASTTMLTWLPFSVPAFLPAVDGTSLSNFIADATAFVDGTASRFLVVNRDQTPCWGGSIVQNPYVGDMHLNQVSISQDQTVSITLARYIVPA